MTAFSEIMNSLPSLGVGLGLRSEIFTDTLDAADVIDWLEITPENYMNRGGIALDQLEQAMAAFPLVSHGVALSLGSVDAWDEAYLSDLEKLFKKVDPPWFSDHLCFSGVDGSYSNDLLPLPRTHEAVAHVVRRIREVQTRFDRPFLIENISYYLEYPGAEMSEAEFISRIVEQSDCGLLLDINNVYVNARNRGENPLDFLRNIPLERVAQIHIAGHQEYPDGIIDTHGEAVCEDVWSLLTWVLTRSRPAGVLLERDLNIPPFAELEVELDRIRTIWNMTQQTPKPKTFRPVVSDPMVGRVVS